MNIFFAGASGYAGYAAAPALVRAGHAVTALLRQPGSVRAQGLREQGVRVVSGDLREPATYRGELAACDAFITTVFDFAAPISTDRLLFEVLRTLPAPASGTRLFIYTTGCLVYGWVPQHILDETTPGNPAHPLHFRMQLEQEALQLPNLLTVVVRPGFLYGTDARSCFVQQWFEQAETGPVLFGGDPDKGWSWLHVDDLADAYCRLVTQQGLQREMFCLANDEQPLSLDVARAVAHVAGRTPAVVLGPVNMEDGSALFDQNQFISSIKARRVLGWSPRQPGIVTGMARYYQEWKSAQALETA